MVHNLTSLGQKFENGELLERFYLIGDTAFTCNRSLISSGNNDRFNFEHSSLRINIVCAFGEIMRGWGILWRPLEMAFSKQA